MWREEAHLDIVAATAVVGRVLFAAETQHVDINNIQWHFHMRVCYFYT